MEGLLVWYVSISVNRPVRERSLAPSGVRIGYVAGCLYAAFGGAKTERGRLTGDVMCDAGK